MTQLSAGQSSELLTAGNHDLGISALRRAYESRARTVEDVLAGVMAKIASSDRAGVWISVATAAQIEEQIGLLRIARAKRVMPLYGVPFAVKDNIDVAGMPTTAACPESAYSPKRSAAAVRRLCEAGAIWVGKVNLDQFATGLVGTRSPYGVCENTFNREWISGGSSSGSAVAVAADLVTFSLGTDTAGSGRVPAAFNNLVGLKPTRGLISAAGVVPACRSLDCVSIFSRDCADAETVLRVGAGFDADDCYSRVAPPAAPSTTTPLRVGIPSPDQLEFFGNSAMADLFGRSIERVKALGCRIVTIDFSVFRRAGDLLYGGPWVAERLVAAGELFHENPAALRPELRTILQDATRYSAIDVFDAQHQLAGLRREADAQFEKMDILLTPTAGTIYRIAEVEASPMHLNRNLSYYTTYVNLLDLSALAVPCGFLPSGLPMGVSFIAPAFQEARLLATGSRFHTALRRESTTC